MKRKIISISLVCILLAVAVVGTLAYLTDKDSAKNTFTFGDVEIKLDEKPVTYVAAQDQWVADDTATRVQANIYEDIYPGATLPKDPTVTNTGKNEAYVRVDITVPTAALEALKAKSSESDQVFDPFKAIITGGVMDNEDFVLSPKTENNIADGFKNDNYLLSYQEEEDHYVFSIYTLKTLCAKGETTSQCGKDTLGTDQLVCFTEINIPEEVTAQDLATLSPQDEFDINVVAYAIQAKGMNTAGDAFAALADAYQE